MEAESRSELRIPINIGTDSLPQSSSKADCATYKIQRCTTDCYP